MSSITFCVEWLPTVSSECFIWRELRHWGYSQLSTLICLFISYSWSVSALSQLSISSWSSMVIWRISVQLLLCLKVPTTTGQAVFSLQLYLLSRAHCRAVSFHYLLYISYLIVVETPYRSTGLLPWHLATFSIFSIPLFFVHLLWVRMPVLSGTVCHSYRRGNSVGSKTFYVEPRFVELFVANLLLFGLILGWSFLIRFLLWT